MTIVMIPGIHSLHGISYWSDMMYRRMANFRVQEIFANFAKYHQYTVGKSSFHSVFTEWRSARINKYPDETFIAIDGRWWESMDHHHWKKYWSQMTPQWNFLEKHEMASIWIWGFWRRKKVGHGWLPHGTCNHDLSHFIMIYHNTSQYAMYCPLMGRFHWL